MKSPLILWPIVIFFVVKWSCTTQPKEEKMVSRPCLHNWPTNIKFNESFGTNRTLKLTDDLGKL